MSNLQQQLENGADAQTRLQQENGILRDALNQASSQAESRQNTELAKLRTDCVRLKRELSDHQADEQRRKDMESKMATAEQQLAELLRSQVERERAQQQRLDDLRLELQQSQDGAAGLRERLVRQDARILQDTAELRDSLACTQAELQALKVQLEQQAQSAPEPQSEEERTAGERSGTGSAAAETGSDAAGTGSVAAQSVTIQQDSGSETDSDQQFESLEEDSQLIRLEEELQRVREESNEAAERHASSLQSDFQKLLQTLFPELSIEADQSDWLQLFTLKAQEAQHTQQDNTHSLQEVLSKLRDAEQNHQTLQSDCERYREVLSETEGTLKSLRQSTEEEEQIWKSKLSQAEEQRQALGEQVLLLEAQLEKQLESAKHEELDQLQEAESQEREPPAE